MPRPTLTRPTLTKEQRDEAWRKAYPELDAKGYRGPDDVPTDQPEVIDEAFVRSVMDYIREKEDEDPGA